MSLALAKILLAGANANSTAAYFKAGSTGLANAANVVLPAGAYIIYPVANVAVQVNNKADGTGWANVGITGSATSALVNPIANACSGFFISDGVNVRISNVGNQLVTSTYVVVGSEQAASGTYNT
jgi:hypothetical protein